MEGSCITKLGKMPKWARDRSIIDIASEVTGEAKELKDKTKRTYHIQGPLRKKKKEQGNTR